MLGTEIRSCPKRLIPANVRTLFAAWNLGANEPTYPASLNLSPWIAEGVALIRGVQDALFEAKAKPSPARPKKKAADRG